ncbi:HAD family hydrolase [Ideonella sp.]|uniref:sulfotransferase-like domain-containing protein n=1 Tax=Ideonella sp. TaxID=1929293 RepID=UPI002B474532|nr:HAD family hydrolase [Ideonella sp.]HJV71083.1 HAD family hydrolase [Ideonella sp.]
MKPVRRVAMWSGPRNISTAMMRAWENRGDCAVSDEPLYAAYLAATGLDHPGRDEIIAAGDTDAERVATALSSGPAPGGQPVWYQKHMTHHLLPGMSTAWVHGLSNVFLIRDPAQVVESYLKSRATVAPPDIGLLQQAALFDEVAERLGKAPPVIDADDFLRSPHAYLQALCERLGIAFTERMLAWPPGRRGSDGIWAPYWYEAVWRSTGFEPWRPRSPRLEGADLAVAEACRPAYERLRACRLVLG